jgi:gliding motility-associated-like protein
MKKLVLAISFLPFLLHAQFIENKGQVMDLSYQAKPAVKYYYESADAYLYFEQNRVVYSLVTPEQIDEKAYENNRQGLDSLKRLRKATFHRFDLVFENANTNTEVIAGERKSGDVHFYLNDRNTIRNVGSFSTITYKNIYNNIDVVFYQSDKGLKYDFVLHHGANLDDIQLAYEGVDNLVLEKGAISFSCGTKSFEENIPLSFIDGDKNKVVEVNYALRGNKVKFNSKIKSFNQLVIDPVLEWATYFNATVAGTNVLDYYNSHLDAAGNFYVYGQAWSGANNYPVINPGGAYTASYNASSDLYLAKFDANRALVWGTYLGGSDGESSLGSRNIVTHNGILHIVGETMTAGAPYTNGGGFYNTTVSRNFWARFNSSTGQLLHLTGLQGGYKPSIAVSNSGLVAIIRDAYDFNNPIIVNRAGAFNQATNGGFKDMYLMLFNASYTHIWGTFLGGPGTQENFMCRFDANDNLYFVGESSWGGSSTIANERLANWAGAYYQSVPGGGTDVMLGRFTSTGVLQWNTLFGGNNSDARQGQQGGYAKIDFHPTSGELILAFNTTSSNLTTINPGGGAYFKTVPTHPSFAGSSGSFWNYAAYYAKFSTAGALNYATYYYNSTDGDLIFDITFGGCNKFYIAGRCDHNTATTIPVAGGFNLPSGQQTYIMQFNNSNFAPEWSSFLANNVSYNPAAAGRPDNPRVYFAARGWNDNGPTVNPGGGAYFQANNINGASSSNFMLWQLHPAIPPQVDGITTLCSGQSTTLTASGGAGAPYQWYTTPSGGTAFHTGAVYNTPALSANVTYYVSSGTGDCASSRTPVEITITPGPAAPAVGSNSPVCVGGTINLMADFVSGATYAWTGPNSFSSPNQNPSLSNATLAMGGTYSLTINVGGCASSAATVNVAVQAPPSAAFSYAGTPYCVGAGSAAVTLAGGATAGVFTSSSGLVVNPANGTVDLSGSTPNTYTVTNTIAAGVCPQVSSDATITINPLDNPSFSYPAAEYCASHANVLPTITGVNGGTFSATPAGLSISPSTGELNFGASATNSYVVTYTTNGTCPNSANFNLAVVANPAAPSISSNSPVCEGGTIELTTPLVVGATYAWTGPNSFSSGNQNPTIINATNLNAGTYNLSYTLNGCVSQIATLNVAVQAAASAGFSYGNTTLCATGSNGVVTLNPGATAGTFTSSAGLVLNSSTGEIDVANSQPGNYTVTNTVAATGTCPEATASVSISIVNADNVDFAYTASNYCANAGTTIPTISGTLGGTFSATPMGLMLNTTTGAIDFSASQPGTYEITYATSGDCGNSSTVQVTIHELPDVPVLVVNNETICDGDDVTVTVQNPQVGVTYNVYSTSAGTTLLGTAPYTYSPTISGNVYVQAVNSAGCVNAGDMTEFTVVVNPSPVISSSGNQSICPGESVTLLVAASEEVSWSTGQNGNSITVSPATTSTYTASATDANGCSASLDIVVTVIDGGSVIAQNDNATVASGQSVTVPVLTNDTGFGGNPVITVNPNSGSAQVEADGTITYTAEEGFSGTVVFTYVICSSVCTEICDEANVTIVVTKETTPTDDEFILPEGFSPNGDGINDFFIVPNLANYPNTQIVIFNRWGTKVFESDNYQNDWNGISQSPLNVGGDELPEGTYFYILTMGGSQNDGIAGETFKGYVYLKR